MDLIWRVLNPNDAEAAAATGAAAEAVDGMGEPYGAEDLIEDLDSSAVDVERGTVGAFAADGRLAAFGMVHARTSADPVHEMFFLGKVHPEFRRRGLGTRLTQWAVEAAREVSEARFSGAPVVLVGMAYDKSPGQTALFEAAGFRADHFSFGMLRRLGDVDPDAAAELPGGYALVPFTAEASEDFRVTHNEAFVPDHPGATIATAESWADRVGGASFRPDLSFGLRHEATGQLAGYILVRHYEADTAATGLRDAYVHYVGTRREHRRKGVATGLLSAVAHAAAKQGFDTVSLGVLAETPTGALGVYEHAGFFVERKFIGYKRDIGPAQSAG